MTLGNIIKTFKGIALTFLLFSVTACVTQQYSDESETPIVENDATQNEMAMTRISLGIGYLNMGNTKQAKFNLEKAKRFAPNLVQVYTAFAHYYDTVGEFELATESYEKALSIKKDDPDTLNNYGVFLCRQGQLEKAEKQFLKAIAVPSYILVSESYENLALCHLKEYHFDKGQEYLEKSIVHSPSRSSSLQQMAILQYAKGDYVQAKTFIKRYEKTTRRFSASALALAFKINEKLRDDNTAKNYAAMLIKMFPQSYEAKQYLLDGLTEIEADKLADAYRLQNISIKKKRVIVLKSNGDSTDSAEIYQPVSKPSTEQANINNAAKVEKKVLVNEQVANNQTLQVPTTAASASEPIASVESFLAKSSANASLVVAEKNPELNEQTSVKTNTEQSASARLPIHLVVKGDSLFSISKQYNIHMKSIIKWNNIKKSQVIKIGDVIYLADPNKAKVK